MDTKLTLKLDREIIERAKKYSSDKKLSLSRIIEVYLQSLVMKSDFDDIQISPFVRSMSTGKSVPAGLNHKKEYSDYLAKKYK